MTDSLSTMTTTTTTVQEITQALAENYFGIGSTPQTALAALAEDLAECRLNADDLEATHLEMLSAIGSLLVEIQRKAGW